MTNDVRYNMSTIMHTHELLSSCNILYQIFNILISNNCDRSHIGLYKYHC